jgi:hypothetical protein
MGNKQHRVVARPGQAGFGLWVYVWVYPAYVCQAQYYVVHMYVFWLQSLQTGVGDMACL